MFVKVEEKTGGQTGDQAGDRRLVLSQQKFCSQAPQDGKQVTFIDTYTPTHRHTHTNTHTDKHIALFHIFAQC